MFLRLLVSGLVIGSAYSLLGLGYSLIYRASGLLNFAERHMLMLGAYFGLTFYKILGWPFWIAIILAMLCAFLTGVLIQNGVIARMKKKGSSMIYILLATVAIGLIIENMCQLIWGSLVVQVPPLFNVPNWVIFGIAFQPEALVVVGVSFVCMLGLHFYVKYSKFGTAMRAASQDVIAAKACGINTSLTTSMTYGIAAAVGALGGTLLGPLYGVSLSLSAAIGSKAYSGAVVGGYGNMYGALVGGILIGLIETFVAASIPSQYKDFISYGLLLVILFVKPAGLLNDRKVFEIR